MTATVINTTRIDEGPEVVVNESYISFKEEFFKFATPFVRDKLDGDENNPKVLDLRSDDFKVFVSLNVGVYNMFYSTLATIVRANKIYPNATYIIDPLQIELDPGNKSFKPFVEKFLLELGVRYRMVDLWGVDGILSNNFITLIGSQIYFSPEDVSDVSKICRSIVPRGSQQPTKKVYMSRKYVDDRTFKNLKPGLSYGADNRIINEPVLEEFFKSHGFEVVYPEEFSSMDEQASFFSEVDVLVSVTSSSIANSLFMNPGGVLVDFTTTFISPYHEDKEYIDGEEAIHHIYHALAYNLDHTYIAIPNHTREASDICDRIINHKHLKRLFNLGE